MIGRIRRSSGREREIDIDILLFGDIVIHEEVLDIPHPRMHDRRFVLVPLVELQPNAMHPVLHKTAEELLAVAPPSQAVDLLYEPSSLHEFSSIGNHD